jgi:hypothetical protein
MLWVSMIGNLLVLVPLLAGLTFSAGRLAPVFGPDSPSRRLLACVLATVALASAAALAQPHKAADIAHTLLPLQVLFSLLALPALGLRHPVALSGLFVAAVHAATTVTLYTR